jgi:hypothetical protein
MTESLLQAINIEVYTQHACVTQEHGTHTKNNIKLTNPVDPAKKVTS